MTSLFSLSNTVAWCLTLLKIRDAALGVKDEADRLLDGFRSVEGSLSGLEDKLQGSTDLLENLQKNLVEVRKRGRERGR